MYLGWNVREMALRENWSGADPRIIDGGNNAAICSAIDFEIAIFEGEKLNNVLDGAGADSEHFRPQHKPATLASGD